MGVKFVKAKANPLDKDDPDVHKLVEDLNKKAFYCKSHPDQQTVLTVTSSKTGTLVLVERVCCQDFRNRLNREGIKIL